MNFQYHHTEVYETRLAGVGLRKPLSGLLIFILLLLCPCSYARTVDSANEYYEDALNLMQEKKQGEAIIQLKNSLNLDSKHIPAMILLGEAYISLNQIESAEITL